MKELELYKNYWGRGYVNSNAQIVYWEYKWDEPDITHKTYYIK
jgi:hypothetical protein